MCTLVIAPVPFSGDFVARDSNFLLLADSIGKKLLHDDSDINILSDDITAAISKLGENIKLRRHVKISKNNNVRFLLTTHYIRLCNLLDKKSKIINVFSFNILKFLSETTISPELIDSKLFSNKGLITLK